MARPRVMTRLAALAESVRRAVGLNFQRRGDAEHLRVGRMGEDAAAEAIRKAGMELIARNARVKFGEADIVARDGDCHVIVEVKTRVRDASAPPLSNTVAPEQSVTKVKLAKLRRIGTWLAKHNRWNSWRIDVVAVEVVREAGSHRVESVRHLRAVS
ncbi:MAG TPA: YraN family protein [Phycisphaerales bacterium]|nr:YraN family protein [Phycisphaerales bacterium]